MVKKLTNFICVLVLLALMSCGTKNDNVVPPDDLKTVTDKAPLVNADSEKKSTEPEEPALVEVDPAEMFEGDDFSVESLRDAIEQSKIYLSRISPDTSFEYGSETYTAKEVIASYNIFLGMLDEIDDREKFLASLKRYFRAFKSPGDADSQRVMYTGYYEPVFKGCESRTNKCRYPAFGKPKDLRVLNLEDFRKDLKGRTIVYRLEGEKIIPYHDREEIMNGVIDQKAEVVAWFENQVDLFFMQVQGSGIIKTDKGELIGLGYSGANGRQYSSIGKYMVGKNYFTLDEASMGSIRKFIEENPQLEREILSVNESYVFFTKRKIESGPRGNINVPLTAIRSVATDTQKFPKAALAYGKVDVPNCDENGSCSGVKKVKRFLVNQDTGGAIRGFGRVDLFWGRGELAEASAGRMRNFGDFYILIAKKDYLILLL